MFLNKHLVIKYHRSPVNNNENCFNSYFKRKIHFNTCISCPYFLNSEFSLSMRILLPTTLAATLSMYFSCREVMVCSDIALLAENSIRTFSSFTWGILFESVVNIVVLRVIELSISILVLVVLSTLIFRR